MKKCKVSVTFNSTFFNDPSTRYTFEKDIVCYFKIEDGVYLVYTNEDLIESGWGVPFTPKQFNELFTTQRDENLNSLLD